MTNEIIDEIDPATLSFHDYLKKIKVLYSDRCSDETYLQLINNAVFDNENLFDEDEFRDVTIAIRLAFDGYNTRKIPDLVDKLIAKTADVEKAS